MEKPKNLYVQPMDMSKGRGGVLERGQGCREEEDKGKRNIGTSVIA